ncbi:MAG: transposase [Candidatus Odinarchaeota archaeon]
MNIKQVLMRLNAVGYEYIQDIRKKLMSQMRDIIRKIDMNISFDEVEEKKEQKQFEKKYKDANLLPLANTLIEEDKLQPEEGKYLLDIFDIQIPLISQLEKEYKKKMGKLVQNELIYTEFLAGIRGIDKVLSAKLVKELGDCSQFKTVSKLWAYCGQLVINGKAPQKRKGVSITYNPNLRALSWVISDCLMKQNKGYYREIYDTEKEKQLNKEYPIGYLHKMYSGKIKRTGKDLYPESAIKLTQGHAHARALRKMRKIFLDHYWHASRELAGLPAKKNYVEGILLHNHISTWREALKRESNKDKSGGIE